ncbi:nicotinate-nucleotide adenylyltransferase [Clostridium sp. MSJ-11]|uniref:Probable nicotinate-nucleotide adenylyltransferase n=1 Tax=Clostridium mobile TaxID=2841512 RepID=A0ABS6EEH2_9CLOT|nr:nicotinate-nucleotide adenylyltransferase [Clostridium mobile]MBU5483552.1 nicotinate-nucleotide adenylyltransferase [Clostridium mobile]
MEKKAIFGGTFDPIHNGHLHIAYEALYRLNLDRIIFMPSGNPPHKYEKDIADSRIRYEMVKMAIREEEKFEINDYEIRKKNISYTYETLSFFKHNYPKVMWHFLTGVDCLMDFDTWKNIDEIMEMCKLIVFNRPGYDKEKILEQKEKLESEHNKEIIFLDIPLLEISSTEIRKAVKENRNIRYFLPEGVYNTIKELKLYI